MSQSALRGARKIGDFMSASDKFVLNCPIFDGEKVMESASVVVENGVIIAVDKAEHADLHGFLMPGLIDAHTHICTERQIDEMLQNGVVAACDVAASVALVEQSRRFKIVSSAGMTFGTLSGKSYVKKAIKNGAAYIKVLLFEPNLMPKNSLKEICAAAHENGKKVAVHATSVKAVRMAVDCGADILLHVPIKEEYPLDLAETIAAKGIVVAPTLVMMQTFANSGRNGYETEHFQNAKNAVRLLHEQSVSILAATDANDGSFAPSVAYGSSLHAEMALLAQCGMTETEVLASATIKIAKAFGIKGLGSIAVGQKATFTLVDGRPDKRITDTQNVLRTWIDGQPISRGKI